jgi:hypothetical protein
MVYLKQVFHHQWAKNDEGQPCSLEVTVHIYHDINDALAWVGHLTSEHEAERAIGHWEQGLLVNLWPLCYAYPTEGFDRRRLTVAFVADRCVWCFSSESGGVMHFARRHFEKLAGSKEGLFADNDTLDRLWPNRASSAEGHPDHLGRL